MNSSATVPITTLPLALDPLAIRGSSSELPEHSLCQFTIRSPHILYFFASECPENDLLQGEILPNLQIQAFWLITPFSTVCTNF